MIEMTLLGVEKLGGIFSNDEIRAMLEIMKRRDLRIRQPLADYNLIMASDDASEQESGLGKVNL